MPRSVSATNHPLNRLLDEGVIREDFIYRLSSNVVNIPSLRQRLDEDSEELARLVSSLIQRTLRSGDDELEDMVVGVLRRDVPEDYRWPGNVRELEQAIRSILITGEYRAGSLSRHQDPREDFVRRMKAGDLTVEALLAEYCSMVYAQTGTYEAAARKVGLDRRTIRSHVEKHRRGTSE